MKNYIKSLIIFVAVLLPFVIMIIFTAAVPAQYSKTFLGELTDKYKRLGSIEGPKIVVVGGSSVAFGLDSELLSEHIGMPVVNFGLYASLGTKIMLDLSEDYIGEGDIIVLAPELDSQTLSLYFNAESTWQALDSNLSMLKSIDKEDYSDLAGGWFRYVSSKGKLWFDGAHLNPEGVYNRSSFNEHGDIVFPRPHNAMKLGYDPNKQIVLEPSIFSVEFIDYLNRYIAEARERGADVFFTFPPMNRTALAPNVTDESILEFYRFICESIDCEVISNINDYIIEENYFFDSNLHLNDSGVTLRTATLIGDLYRTIGRTQSVGIDIPAAPERPAFVVGTDGDDVWAPYFIYSEFTGADGKVIGYTVTGVTDEGKTLVKLEFPSMYNGHQVITVTAGALEGCSTLTDITIRSNIISIENGAFSDAPALRRIHIYNEDEMSMSVSPNGLFDGAASGISICFYTKSSFDAYTAGYYWGNYSSMMKLIS